jgi:uncharacterized SAM-binding protein YcdF (DUF218 family)
MKWSRKLTYQILQGFLAGFALIGVGGAGVSLVTAYYLAGEIYDYQDSVDGVHLPQVDAIVCLAGGRGRIAAAGDLWYRYLEQSKKSPSAVAKVPVLYLSGTGRQMTWALLLKQFRSGISQSILPSSVIIENESSNTDENARWLIHYARERGWKRIILLTSSYHMKRARYIFDQVLKNKENPIEVETLSVYQEPFTPDEWRTGPNGIRVTLLEYMKWVYYRSFWRSKM